MVQVDCFVLLCSNLFSIGLLLFILLADPALPLPAPLCYIIISIVVINWHLR